jgi:hypothetical protein
LADRAERRENGAIPPGVWQPAHFSAKIGATLDQVGADARVEALPLDPPDPPAAMVVAAIATAAAAASARASLFRVTGKG